MTILSLLDEWDSNDADAWGYAEHYSFLELATKHVLVGYEPTAGAGSTFLDRLSGWVFNLPDGSLRQKLFRLTAHLQFVSQRDLDASFRYVFESLVPWWLIETLDLDVTDQSLRTVLDEALRETWFCGITDSLLIARFHHLNRLAKRDHRPDWRTLERFGDADRIGSYMEENGLKRLVLLEDFIGTGTQAAAAMDFAAGLPFIDSVLLSPMVICANGLAALQSGIESHPHVTLEPVQVVPEAALLTPSPTAGEPEEFDDFRELIEATYVYLEDSLPEEQKYGYKGTGALMVLYSNCPNNSVAIIHHETESWRALFPRSVRR